MAPQSSRIPVSEDRRPKTNVWRLRSTGLLLLSLLSVFALSCLFSSRSSLAQSGQSPQGEVSLSASAGGPDARESRAEADPIAEACRMIYQGQFDAAEGATEQAKGSDADRVGQLEGIIRQYERISRDRQAARAQAFEEQLAELDKLKASMDLDQIAQSPVTLDADDPNLAQAPRDANEPNSLPEALAVVAKASEYADSGQKVSLLCDPFVAKLLQVSVDRSAVLEAEGKWIDAYAQCYYWLRAIDPNNHGYSGYVDELLDKASISASFQDSPCETRKERYEGVEARMFKRSIDALDLHYVNSISYVKMATEALKRSSFLAEVLTVAFPDGLESDNGSAFEVPTKAEVSAWNAALSGLQD